MRYLQEVLRKLNFWFASIKVITIIAFIILGGAAMFGFLDMKGNEPAPMFSSFTDYGGLFPNGLSAILITMIAVNFFFPRNRISWYCSR